MTSRPPPDTRRRFEIGQAVVHHTKGTGKVVRYLRNVAKCLIAFDQPDGTTRASWVWDNSVDRCDAVIKCLICQASIGVHFDRLSASDYPEPHPATTFVYRAYRCGKCHQHFDVSYVESLINNQLFPCPSLPVSS
jgi:hypothetical protein